MRKDIERDPQLAALLQDSFAPCPADEAERFTRRVMQRLPHRRRKPVLTLLLAYIQSPLWLVTASILCVTALVLRIDDIMERLANPLSLALLVILLTSATTLLFLDMLHDVEEVKDSKHSGQPVFL